MLGLETRTTERGDTEPTEQSHPEKRDSLNSLENLSTQTFGCENGTVAPFDDVIHSSSTRVVPVGPGTRCFSVRAIARAQPLSVPVDGVLHIAGSESLRCELRTVAGDGELLPLEHLGGGEGQYRPGEQL